MSNTSPQNLYCDTCRSIRRFQSISEITRPHSTATRSFQPCPYFKQCLEFMLTLAIPKSLFNRKFNRCYCERCYPTSSRDYLIEGGAKYVLPRGWVRFGLYVDEAQAAAQNIWAKWVVTYHGTNPVVAQSIIEHHSFLLPGDHSIDGKQIRIRPGHIPGKFHIYTSPTIAYSGHDIYATAIPYRSPSGKHYQAKTVLQCRQNPANFQIQRETIGARDRRLCPIIPNTEIEYFTEVRASIVPYGLLIRLVE